MNKHERQQKLLRTMSEWMGAKRPRSQRFQIFAAITMIVAGIITGLAVVYL